MRQFILFGCIVVGCVCGWFGHKTVNPYALDYGKMVINLPVTYTHYLSNPAYPLGEKYLAEDMVVALAKNGVDVRIYAMEDLYSNLNFKAGYELYMRAYPELRFSRYHNYLDEDKIAVLFETIPYKIEEVKQADVVFTGSLRKSREYQKMGIAAYFLPQFTRLDKFYYEPKEELKHKLLFVGNKYTDAPSRKVIEYSLEYGLKPAVYGAGWADVLVGENADLYKGYQIRGEELRYFYSSADIVLNDTREDMIEAGFISNRIYDVTACGAFIISDYIPEIEEIYGDSVPMYKNKEEFKALIDYYLAHPEERQEKARQAQKITRERFGAEAVMKEMMRLLEQYRKERGIGE